MSSSQLQRKNFVLVDYENVQVDSLVDLDRDPFEVLILVGANQKRASMELLLTVNRLGKRVEVKQVLGTGHNALDFHIAFYIGQLSKEHPGAFFHIISKDTGFDPLIKHLKSEGIYAGRWQEIGEIPLVKSIRNLSPKQRADAYLERLDTQKISKPVTKKRLLNSVSASFHKQLSEEELSCIIDALRNQKRIRFDGERVIWIA